MGCLTKVTVQMKGTEKGDKLTNTPNSESQFEEKGIGCIGEGGDFVAAT